MGRGWGAAESIIRVREKGSAFLRAGTLGVLGCCTITCLILAVRQAPTGMWLHFVVVCGLTVPLVLFLLRHTGMAVLVAAAPLPGDLLYFAVYPGGGHPAVAVLSLGLGLIVSILIGDAISAFIASGDGPRPRLKETDRNISRLAGTVVLVLLVPAWGSIYLSTSAALLELAVASTSAVVSATLVLRLTVPYLNCDEDFVVRANRAREWFARLFAPLLPVARPRFGFSIFGVGCATGAVAFFGAKQLHPVPWSALWLLSLAGATVLTASQIALRDWRRSLATFLSTALAAQIGVWASVRLGVPLSASMEAAFLTILSATVALELCIASEAVQYIVAEDDVIAGSERAIERKSMALCVGGMSLAISIFPIDISVFALWFCLVIFIAAAVVAAILFQPAIAIAIEGLVPRAATISARYRIR